MCKASFHSKLLCEVEEAATASAEFSKSWPGLTVSQDMAGWTRRTNQDVSKEGNAAPRQTGEICTSICIFTGRCRSLLSSCGMPGSVPIWIISPSFQSFEKENIHWVQFIQETGGKVLNHYNQMLETNNQKGDALNQGRNEWAHIISWWRSNHHWQRLNLREQRQENVLQGIQHHPHGQAGLGGDGLVHRSSECHWWGETETARTRHGFGPLNWSRTSWPEVYTHSSAVFSAEICVGTSAGPSSANSCPVFHAIKCSYTLFLIHPLGS